MKREIAQLLESGQDQTARIRVITSVSYNLPGCVKVDDFQWGRFSFEIRSEYFKMD